ncbi:Uncharacterized protein HI1418 [Sinorhizobium fredii HH103]|uniref:Uncharacterized protein HI1418 n=1 Tax=Sinorhizobium fredii (strain HH103) TaxID=1117943 RepID=G9A115_SINF1|nr:Uncharacterized protein HI1418 [Sinorhizobium fredii HH103]
MARNNLTPDQIYRNRDVPRWPPRSRALDAFDYLSKTVRVIKIDDQPWFVAQDVGNALGLPQKSHGYAVMRLDEEQSSLHQIQTGRRSPRIISESGLYRLIMRSDKPEARQFQDWVTKIVLPAIRKDGMYVTGEESEITCFPRRDTGSTDH